MTNILTITKDTVLREDNGFDYRNIRQRGHEFICEVSDEWDDEKGEMVNWKDGTILTKQDILKMAGAQYGYVICENDD